MITATPVSPTANPAPRRKSGARLHFGKMARSNALEAAQQCSTAHSILERSPPDTTDRFERRQVITHGPRRIASITRNSVASQRSTEESLPLGKKGIGQPDRNPRHLCDGSGMLRRCRANEKPRKPLLSSENVLTEVPTGCGKAQVRQRRKPLTGRRTYMLSFGTMSTINS